MSLVTKQNLSQEIKKFDNNIGKLLDSNQNFSFGAVALLVARVKQMQEIDSETLQKVINKAQEAIDSNHGIFDGINKLENDVKLLKQRLAFL